MLNINYEVGVVDQGCVNERVVQGGARLVRMEIHDYDSSRSRPGQLLKDIKRLRDLVPNGSGLWTHQCCFDGGQDGYITWNIVIACPTPLSEQEWRSVREQMRQILEMTDLGYHLAPMMAPLDKEQEQWLLSEWYESTSKKWGETMGSVDGVLNVLYSRSG